MSNQPPPHFGAGNVWVNDINEPDIVETQLEQARQLGLNAIRAPVRGDFLPAPESFINEAEALLNVCNDPQLGGPYHVLFDLGAPDPHPYTPLLVQIPYEGLPGDWRLTPSGAAVAGYVPPAS